MSDSSAEDQVTLLELLDRVLDRGVVLSGDITLCVADVDLVQLDLRLLLSSTEAARRLQLHGSGEGSKSNALMPLGET